MDDDAFQPEVIVTLREPPRRDILFICIACGEEIEKPRYGWARHSQQLQREPICSACTRRWGRRTSGPVFNRRNFHALAQLSAVITMLEWEIRNGKRRHRH